MTLYLKQKFFSWKDRSTVTDENGEARYFVEGKVFSLGKKLTVTDPQGEEVAFIRQKLLTFMPRFVVERNGIEVAEIVKKFSFFKPKYEIEGIGWTVQGDIFAHDYEILDGDRTVVNIHKKWMTWGDSFALDIDSGADPVMALAVVLAIDAVLDSQTAASASAGSAASSG